MQRTLVRKFASVGKYLNNEIIVKESSRNLRRLGTIGHKTLRTLRFNSEAGSLLYSTSANQHTISVSNDNQSESIKFKWSKTDEDQYPYLWLRDNCQCPKCYNESSMSRRLLMRQLNPDTTPAEIKIEEEVQKVHIKWSDEHESTFTFDWLKKRNFRIENRKSRLEWMKSTKRYLWNTADMQNKLPTVRFKQLLTDDVALYNWISTLEETGIHLIVDTPTQNGELLKLANRIAFLRKTNYGELFQVKAKLDPSNQGYTPDALGLHTDLAYYWYPPFVSCLHCISQVPTKGGETELADGFYIAERIRKEHPEHFETLTTVPVDFYDEGKDYYKFYNLTKHLTIGLDADGHIERIVYNNPVRDTFLTIPVEKVQALYRALCLFEAMLYDPKNMVKFKLKPGQIVCYQNVRVLHGRTGFEILKKGAREVEGGNFDWDELLSRRRVIATEQGFKS